MRWVIIVALVSLILALLGGYAAAEMIPPVG